MPVWIVRCEDEDIGSMQMCLDSMRARVHSCCIEEDPPCTTDEDCWLGKDDICFKCGVEHQAPCAHCGATYYCKPGCPEYVGDLGEEEEGENS